MILALSFSNAGVLSLLLALPLLWLLARRYAALREARLQDAIGPRVDRLAGVEETTRSKWRHVSLAVAFSMLVVALAEPRHGTATSGAGAVPTLDILVCLDVSRSMRARDLEPDRLGYAHEALAGLAQRARGDRLGLVAFAGNARLLVPLTEDVDSFVQLVRTTDEISVERGGTDLAAALSTALEALALRKGEGADEQPGRAAAILLLTDGEDLAGQGLAVAETCRRRGIPVHCVGLGSALGSKIPVMAAGGGEAFLEDADGQDVISRLDAVFLETLATRSGGSFRTASVGSSDTLVEIYDTSLRPLARAVLTSSVTAAEEPRWRLPLALAWLGILLAMCLGRRRDTGLKPSRAPGR